MKIKVPTSSRARIEMLPLIDIVFLLLVVFIYAMLSMAVHRGLPVALPVSSQAAIDSRPLVSLTVNRPRNSSDLAVHIDKQPVRLAELAARLREKTAADPEQAVLLFADHTLPYQDLYSVLDQIRRAGIGNVSLQASGPGNSGTP